MLNVPRRFSDWRTRTTNCSRSIRGIRPSTSKRSAGCGRFGSASTIAPPRSRRVLTSFGSGLVIIASMTESLLDAVSNSNETPKIPLALHPVTLKMRTAGAENSSVDDALYPGNASSRVSGSDDSSLFGRMRDFLAFNGRMCLRRGHRGCPDSQGALASCQRVSWSAAAA